MSTQAAATLGSWGRWWPTLRLAADEPIKSLVDRLNAWQPDMLGGYSSMMVFFAEQLANRLRIAPELIMVGSEVVTAETRRLVELAWGKQPFEGYGVTECAGLAAECIQHHGLNLYEDLAFIEVVDDDNRPVPPGQYGAKVLISVFISRAQPLIRYDVSDSLRVTTEVCPCGRPFALVNGIQGLVDEVLRFSALAGGEVAVQPVAMSAILDPLPVSGWQVVQEENGSLTIFLSGTPDVFTDDSVLKPLRQRLAAQGADVPATW